MLNAINIYSIRHSIVIINNFYFNSKSDFVHVDYSKIAFDKNVWLKLSVKVVSLY